MGRGIAVAHVPCVIHAPGQALLEKRDKALIDTIDGVGDELEFVGSPRGSKEMRRGAFPEAAAFSPFLSASGFVREWFWARRSKKAMVSGWGFEGHICH